MEVSCGTELQPTQLRDVIRFALFVFSFKLLYLKQIAGKRSCMEELVIRGYFGNLSSLSGPTSTARNKTRTHFPSSVDEKALNTQAVIQLCVSASKGQLAIRSVSPSLGFRVI